MVIIRYPKDYDIFLLQEACERLYKLNPKEQYLFIREDSMWISLSLEDLYKVKEEVEKAINDKEIMQLYKYGRL